MLPLVDGAYRSILRPILFRLDPERTHRFAIRVLSGISTRKRASDPPELRTNILGLEFTNPVGLAAGMDKDAHAVGAWQRLGFGFAEIGTVTPRPQPGNHYPRIWRLPQHRGLINRLGFPSDGMEIVASRLEAVRRNKFPVKIGINIGPNKNTPADRVVEDYAALTSRVAALADFLVINVSSPNTPGLRELQAPARIKAITEAVRSAPQRQGRKIPVLIKIAPDLSGEDLDRIADTALELRIEGIVATNTTLQRKNLGISCNLEGGLSGAPLKQLSRRTIARLHRRLHGAISVIGAGGIASAEDAYAHVRAGASLIEIYTALIYQGPLIAYEIKRGLVRLLARDGFRSISEAVGTAESSEAL
jgi:dihydroorotate dehydrogenase